MAADDLDPDDLDPGPLDLRLALAVLRVERLGDTIRTFAVALGRDLDEAARGLGHSATGRALSQVSADCACFVAGLDQLAGRTGGEQWRNIDGDHDPRAIRRP